MNWKPGDACTLTLLRFGEVLTGTIETRRGHKMVVATDDGRRFSADIDNPYILPLTRDGHEQPE